MSEPAEDTDTAALRRTATFTTWEQGTETLIAAILPDGSVVPLRDTRG